MGLRIGIVASALAVGGVLYAITRSAKSDPGPLPAQASAAEQRPEDEPQPMVDIAGWGSAPVLAVRAAYRAADAGERDVLSGMFDGRALAERAAGSEFPEQHPPASWEELSAGERAAFLSAQVDRLLEESDASELDEHVSVAALWKPFDGEVVSQDEQRALVRLRVSGRDAERAAETRLVDWRLTREDGANWRIAGWERHLTDDEVRAASRKRTSQVSKVELEDGTRLYQAEPRTLEHLEETPAALRTSIDEALQRMLDFDLRPRENVAAQAELVAAGRAAIPPLLTQMHLTEMVDHDAVSRVAKVHQTLFEITGYDPGFSVTSLDPDVDEHRKLAVNAWFAWWIRKGEKSFFGRPADGEELDGDELDD